MRELGEYFIIIVIIALLVAGCGVPSVFAGQQIASEYKVKAAFLYNFINFVEWPPQSSFDSDPTITLCIIGDDQFGDAFNDFQNESIKGKKLNIEYRAFDDLRGCSILYLTASEKHHATKIVRSVGKSSILTVSDTEESSRQGIIISFFIEQKKVRFAINVDAARRAGLKISSKLLKLANIVVTADNKDDTE